mmetsp:Transcript_28198/g.74473  ORF Transcript_28198/g.74473 Transcript_28198/m.74473 type:complete len:121 (+) Transcript_28198:189-551(+)
MQQGQMSSCLLPLPLDFSDVRDLIRARRTPPQTGQLQSTPNSREGHFRSSVLCFRSLRSGLACQLRSEEVCWFVPGRCRAFQRVLLKAMFAFECHAAMLRLRCLESKSKHWVKLYVKFAV